MSIGVIGNGVVGRATARCFMESANVKVWDVDKERATAERKSVELCDLCFVCVPEGAVDTYFAYCDRRGRYVLKSTVPIGTTRRLSSLYGAEVCHSPEFLTARCAVTDAQLPARNIIGRVGLSSDPRVVHNKLHTLLAARFPGVPTYLMSSDESEAVKLMVNSLFAVKVCLFNTYHRLCSKLGLSWQSVLQGILSDGRVAHSHTNVPGPDGKYGFGGACLPKDLRQLIEAYRSANEDELLLTATEIQNGSDRVRVH